MIKSILWDFDGVIAESVNVKTDAFYEMYLPYGKDVAECVVEHHMENGGVSRFEKFRHYHNTFLNIKLTDQDIKTMSQTFSDLVLRKVVSSPYIPGVIEFIQKTQSKYKHFVISGTPNEEMKEIVSQRNIQDLFQDVMGSPKTKTEWIHELVKSNKIEISQSVFVGDAMTDFKAANETGMKFVLREVDYNIDLFNKYMGVRVKDFVSFYTVVEAM